MLDAVYPGRYGDLSRRWRTGVGRHLRPEPVRGVDHRADFFRRHQGGGQAAPVGGYAPRDQDLDPGGAGADLRPRRLDQFVGAVIVDLARFLRAMPAGDGQRLASAEDARAVGLSLVDGPHQGQIGMPRVASQTDGGHASLQAFPRHRRHAQRQGRLAFICQFRHHLAWQDQPQMDMHVHQAGDQPGASSVYDVRVFRHRHAAGFAYGGDAVALHEDHGALQRGAAFKVHHRAADNGDSPRRRARQRQAQHEPQANPAEPEPGRRAIHGYSPYLYCTRTP